MPRPPTKKTQVLSLAYHRGKFKAEEEHEKKLTLPERLRPYLQRLIDKIDPIEAVAILGTTMLIKTGIDWTEEAVVQATAGMNNPFVRILLFGPFYGLIVQPVPGSMEQSAEELKKLLSSNTAELNEWIISFTVAFLIVRNFGAIVSGAGNVINMAKNLMGIAAVAA